MMSLELGCDLHAGWGGLKTPSEEKNCRMDCLAVSVAVLYKERSLVTSSKCCSA